MQDLEFVKELAERFNNLLKSDIRVGPTLGLLLTESVAVDSYFADDHKTLQFAIEDSKMVLRPLGMLNGLMSPRENIMGSRYRIAVRMDDKDIIEKFLVLEYPDDGSSAKVVKFEEEDNA